MSAPVPAGAEYSNGITRPVGSFDDGRHRTQSEVALMHGVTRKRIDQIEREAIRKLRWAPDRRAA